MPMSFQTFQKVLAVTTAVIVMAIFVAPANARIDVTNYGLQTFDDTTAGTSMSDYGFDEIGAVGATAATNSSLLGNHFEGTTAGGGSQVLRAFFDNVPADGSVTMSAILDDWSGNSSFGWGSMDPVTQVNAGPKSGGWGFGHAGSTGGTIDTGEPYFIQYTVNFVGGESSTYEVRYEQPVGTVTYEHAGIENPLGAAIDNEDIGFRIFVQSGGGDFDNLNVYVPEPMSLVLATLGFVGVLLFGSRRKLRKS